MSHYFTWAILCIYKKNQILEVKYYMTTTTLIIFVILFLLSAIAALVIFRMRQDRTDRKTNLYLFGMFVGGLLAAFFAWLFKYLELNTTTAYLILQVLFLGTGCLHLHFMYGFMWSVRDRDYWERDSVISETAFTILSSQLMVIGFFALYYIITKDYFTTINYWGLFVPFLLPLATMKLYDFMNHIPYPEFDTKWDYQLTDLDESRWNWANMVEIHFQLIDSYDNEEKLWGAKKAWFSIQAPRDQPLTQVYRLALRVYHEKAHTIPVQDIGYEHNPPLFWWLFYVKFNIFRPRTWFVKNRYLDPYATLEQNYLQNHYLVSAKRMAY